MKIYRLLIIILSFGNAVSQNTQKDNDPASLYNQLTGLDKAVFDAFNNCDIEKFKSYFTNDVEFYHDKGGVTLTSNGLAASVKNSICGNPNIKVRRELLPETVQVYKMDNYGAIISGEHLFYQTIDGEEKLTGRARFTHLCEFKDNSWKIHRVLSYDHREIK